MTLNRPDFRTFAQRGAIVVAGVVGGLAAGYLA